MENICIVVEGLFLLIKSARCKEDWSQSLSKDKVVVDTCNLKHCVLNRFVVYQECFKKLVGFF